MDLESEENAEKDEFFEECLNDPTLRDQMSILTRKFKNKMQVMRSDKYHNNYHKNLTLHVADAHVQDNSKISEPSNVLSRTGNIL